MTPSAETIYNALLLMSDNVDAAVWFVAREHILYGNIDKAYKLAAKSKHADAIWFCSILSGLPQPIQFFAARIRFANCYPDEENDARFCLFRALLNRVYKSSTNLILESYTSIEYARTVDPIAMFASGNPKLVLKAAKLGNDNAIRTVVNGTHYCSLIDDYCNFLAFYTIVMSGNIHFWVTRIELLTKNDAVYIIGKWMHHFPTLAHRGPFLTCYHKSNLYSREAVNQWLLVARRIGSPQLPREIRKMIGELIWSSRVEGLYR